MEPTRIIAVRHGETEWNVATRIQGQLDVGLNERGLWQARRTARALQREDIAALYSSDLARARSTAHALGALNGLAVQPDRGLRERGFGVFEGKTFAEIEAEHPEEARRWRQRDLYFEPAGGESLTTFYARVVGTFTRLAQSHPGEQIAVFAHGGVLDALYRAASHIPLAAPRTWQLANTAINRVLYYGGHGDHGEGFSLVGWGDVSHLEDQALDEAL
jgi:2,3-bisphosphoglycerate-dependent phosphoglycerate mutase